MLTTTGTGAAVGQSPEAFAFPNYSGRELTFVGHGGKSQENFANSFAAPFAAKTGLVLKQDSPSDLAKIRVQVESNNVTWDFVNIDAGFVMGNCGTLFEPITADMSTITPDFRYGDCVLPVGMTAITLLYDPTAYGDNPPTSWADYYDTTNFPGKRGLPTFASGSGAFESALIADGVDPSQLYPIDIDRAIAKLDTIKPDILFFDNLPAAVEQIVAKQVTMTILPMSRALEQDRAGGGFEGVFNKHLYSPGTFSIPKGADDLDVAQSLAAYALTPEAQISISQALALGPSVAGVELTGDLKWIATTPDRLPNGVVVNLEWWGENLQEATERYTEWAAG